MKIIQVLTERGKGVSFEFFPPKTAEGRKALLEVIKGLKVFNPLYVSVTYGAGGTTTDRTKETIYEIQTVLDEPVMSHLTCIGATRSSIRALLDEYRQKGVENILALRGDKPQDVEDFDPSKGEFKYARDLVEFIKKEFPEFGISVAVYPEGHQEAPSLEADLEYTRIKIDAGADFAITQMFFDNSYYYDFLDRAQKKGIDIPILPGIMPITDIVKIKRFASFCKATIPAEVEKRFEPYAESPEDMLKLGVELAIKQCEDLIGQGVRFLHFYTLNREDAVSEILKALVPTHFS
ncbi:MAG: methylenetetrahydrofolate reductase [NAD(P)H] [Nitrospirae bacterium]|nr:methylenetetrahydrofolate reductase [NAD(P)H] [Nitrospirota bacterium]